MPRLTYQNLELLYFDELMKGTANVFTNRKGVVYQKKKIVPQEGGIYSDVKSRLIDDDVSISEYSCDPNCKFLTGKFYENSGIVCPKCGKPVTYNFGINIENQSWISILDYKVMTPIGYIKTVELIGEKNLLDIISFNDNIDLQGRVIIGNPNLDKKDPFSKIGMIEFYNRYEEIVKFYGKGTEKKRKTAEFLISKKNRIFTSKINVISQNLRPAFISSNDKTFRYDGINAIYSVIISNATLISKAHLLNQYMNINKYLCTIQEELNKLYTTIVKKLDGKEKLFRRKIQGTRMSWSCREVIVANTGKTYGIDHMTISYKGFLEMYFYEILNCLKRGIVTEYFVDKTLYEIAEYLEINKYSLVVDPIIYKVMKWLIENHEDGLWCIVNRPPTLKLGSIQVLKIVDVFNNAIENKMGVPLTSLSPWNGDFDGDTLSVYSIKEKCVLDEFNKNFNPKHLIVDKTSGYKIYNAEFGLTNDFKMFLNAFVPENKEEEVV